MAERPEDLNLPTSIVTKLIKDCLPSSCKVSKEANAAIAKAASVFILYATASANSVAQKSSRKTITGPDVVNAMSDMDFEKFVRPLENNLAIWKKTQKDKKDSAAAKKEEAVAKKKAETGENDKKEEGEEAEEVVEEENKENNDNNEENKDSAQ